VATFLRPLALITRATVILIGMVSSVGFDLLGFAIEWAPGRTMGDSDIVLKRMV
jgi:hypothetical protein